MKKIKLHKLQNPVILLIILIIIMGSLSYILPQGEFSRYIDKDNGVEYVLNDSFEFIERNPLGVFEILTSIFEGTIRASSLIMFILFSGGAIGIIEETGFIHNLLSTLSSGRKKSNRVLLFIVCLLFSSLGSFLGLSEELIAFLPIILNLTKSMGYDRRTGVASTFLASTVGFGAGVMNPFTVGITQTIAQLPTYSGIIYRFIIFICFTFTTYFYILYKAKDINKLDNAEYYFDDLEYLNIVDNNRKFTKRDLTIGITIVAGLIIIVIGILYYSFKLKEIATMFLIISFLCSYISKLSSTKAINSFFKGAGAMLYPALLVGLARGIIIVMEYGKIIDTIIFYFLQIMGDYGKVGTSLFMFLFQSVVNIFLISGSAQATITMPLMLSVSDMAALNRQISVLIFQFGDSLFNVISPTLGYLLATLSLAGISYRDWFRYVKGFVFIWTIEMIVFTFIAIGMNYGPF